MAMGNATILGTLMSAYTFRSVELNQLLLKCDDLQNKVSSLEEEIAELKELLRLQQQRRFGKKSEASKGNDENKEKAITVSAHTRTRKKPGRLLDTKNLNRYSIVHDLPESDQVCECCKGPLHVIGRDISEQVEVIPAQYTVIEHVRMKYGCRPCQRIKMAPKPFSPIPKAIAGASLITDILVNKYQYHLPLYRQSKIMASNHINIPDNTLGNWTMKVGEGLLTLYEALWEILNASYLQVDETPIKILEPDKKGYLWTYYAPHVGKGMVVFEMSETRSGNIANERLATFNGLLQTDGYKGYDKLRHRKGIVGLGCLSHARRKFNEVVKITGDKKGIAAEMLERMKPLYALEARMREDKRDFRTRKRLRQRIARPITNKIYCWLRTIKNNVPPKSQLGNAIQYTLNQWKYITGYLRHGEAEIDTNKVENKIREIALGRKNWLFMHNEESGKIHALFYSLVLSSVLNEINPRVYLHYVISKIHEIRRGTVKPIDLLPDRIDIIMLQQFAEDQITLAKKLLNSS
jgi:transposase